MYPNRPSRRLAAVLVAVPLALLAVAASAHAQAAAGSGNLLDRLVNRPAQEATGDVTLVRVRGTGTVPVTPDRALVTLGVARAAPTAAEAIAASSAAVAKVVTALTAAGVAADAIQAGAFSLAPAEAAVPAPRAGSAAAPARFRAVNTVTVSTAQVADLGRLIQTAVDAGADDVQGVQWLVSDPERHRAAALKAAVAAATADGRALAAALGGRVARVVEVTTLDGGTLRSAPAATPAESAPSLVPGPSTVDAAVELTLAVTGASLPPAPTPAPAGSRTGGPMPAVTAAPYVSATPSATPPSTVAAGSAATNPATATPSPAGSPQAGTVAAPSMARTPLATAATAPSGRGIPFVAVTQADTGRYRGTQARAIVVTSPADWERMVAPLLPRTLRFSPDYDRDLAVVVFLGERPSTGFALKVREVTTEDGQLTVHVDTVEPGGTLDRASGPTSPFQVITVRRADLPAGVKEPLQAEVMP
jgi:uncharacterized protein